MLKKIIIKKERKSSALLKSFESRKFKQPPKSIFVSET